MPSPLNTTLDGPLPTPRAAIVPLAVLTTSTVSSAREATYSRVLLLLTAIAVGATGNVTDPAIALVPVSMTAIQPSGSLVDGPVVREPATNRRLPSALSTISCGRSPTVTVLIVVLVAVSTTDTELPSWFATYASDPL